MLNKLGLLNKLGINSVERILPRAPYFLPQLTQRNPDAETTFTQRLASAKCHGRSSSSACSSQHLGVTPVKSQGCECLFLRCKCSLYEMKGSGSDLILNTIAIFNRRPSSYASHTTKL